MTVKDCSVQLVNCSASIRSSRLCSGSNSSVTVRSRDSRIMTSTTSRTSCESAVALTGRLYGSSTWKRISRSEEHTSELQSLMRISYAVFCLQKKTKKQKKETQLSEQQYDSI